MTKRTILHADLNSFFARAEQQTNPTLRGKPIGVVKAKGRSCIIAASTEAKKHGVTTGCRVKEAKKLCPQIILIPADFAKYEDVSLRFIKICEAYSPLCEVFSLDECFIDVTETEKFWGHAFNIAFEIKDRIRNEIGDWLTCSIGISHNRLLAKLASSQIKPDGLFWITEDNAKSILDKSKLTDVCGLGQGLYQHLISLGIENFAKLRLLSLPYLYKHFGPFWSYHLYNLARGIDNSQVTSYNKLADAKSVGRTYTTHRLLTKRAEIEQLIRNLCEETTAKARTMGLAGKYISLAIRGQDDEFFGHLTLKSYIDNGKILFEICKQISSKWYIQNLIFCGVTLAMLVKKEYITMPLFITDGRYQNLVEAQDKINRRFGDYTIFPAQLLGMPIIRPEVTGFLGDKTYRLNYNLKY